MRMCFVLTSVENKLQAEMIMKNVLERKLSSCIQCINVNTKYVWENDVLGDQEILMIIRTNDEAYDELDMLLSTIHPYQVPEITMIYADKVSDAYLNWLNNSIR